MAEPSRAGRETAGGKSPDTEYSVFVFSSRSKIADTKKLVDFTEKRLLFLIERSSTVKRKMLLIALLHDYRKGLTAVAWRGGEPVYLRMGEAQSKDAREPAAA